MKLCHMLKLNNLLINKTICAVQRQEPRESSLWNLAAMKRKKV